MITNERQYEHTNAAAERFRTGIAAAEAKPATKARDATIAGMRAQLRTLEAELRAYERLKASGGRDFDVTFDDVGVMLVQARIARRWLQKDLAERLELSVQTIERYEKTDYETASLTTLRDAVRVLGLQVTCSGSMIQLVDFSELKTRRTPKVAK